MLRKVQCLTNYSCYLRITWMSVILSMCLALRIAVRNSKGKIWKSIWRTTVQIGPSLAPSARKRFCGTGWRFVLSSWFTVLWVEKVFIVKFDSHVAVTSNTHDLTEDYGHCETQMIEFLWKSNVFISVDDQSQENIVRQLQGRPKKLWQIVEWELKPWLSFVLHFALKMSCGAI